MRAPSPKNAPPPPPGAATPPAAIARLNAAIRAALGSPAVIDKLGALGSEARGSTPEEFNELLLREGRKWADVMTQANIKVSE